MEYVKPTAMLRKQRGLTQLVLAVSIERHVNQIKRYPAATAQPTDGDAGNTGAGTTTTLDNLVFGEDQRGPTDDATYSLRHGASLMRRIRRLLKHCWKT